MRYTTTLTLVAILALGFVSMVAAGPSGMVFLRGDVDGDGKVDAIDLNALTLHVISGGNISVPVLEALDVVDDGKIDAADVAALEEQLGTGTAGHFWDFLEYTLGDLHRDTRIDSRDYRQLRAIVYKKAPVSHTQMDAADINGDGKIDRTDLRFFRRLMRRR